MQTIQSRAVLVYTANSHIHSAWNHASGCSVSEAEREFAVYLRVELTQDDELLFLSPWKSHTSGNPLSLSSIFYELRSSHAMRVFHFLCEGKAKLVIMKPNCADQPQLQFLPIIRAKTETSLWKITESGAGDNMGIACIIKSLHFAINWDFF